MRRNPMQRVVYVISDLHLSAGRDPHTGDWDVLEDFIVDDAFVAFLNRISRDNPDGAELVIAGDFLEYPQTLPELGPTSPADHLSTTEEESLARTRVILGMRPERASGHPALFARLRQFLNDGHHVTILIGNHDIDLAWPSVWQLVCSTLETPGMPGRLRLLPYSYTVGKAERGRVYIEHGNEYDSVNAFGEQQRNLFDVDSSGVQRLKRCLGTLFVDKVYNDLERERWFMDNVKPMQRIVLLGLQNDLRFTATALALIAKFFILNGTRKFIFGSTDAAVLGAAPLDTETVLGAVEDEEVRRLLAAQLNTPAAQAEFEQAVQQFSTDEQLVVRVGTTDQPKLDEVVETVPAAEDGVVLGGFFGPKEDAYRKAAREYMAANRQVSAVIMGHTHGPIDGNKEPILFDGGRQGFYHNSGTWTRHLPTRPERPYSWAEINDESNYISSMSYLRLVPNEWGEYHVEYRYWGSEMG
jgi:UDP-2,3-diacylglucosamine pyrophosphatase LpxH